MKKLLLLLIVLCMLITTVYAYNLTTIVNGNKLTATVNSGENVELQYNDVDGYTFESWNTTGVTLPNPTSKNTIFTMPTNDVTIEPNMTEAHVHEFNDATCTKPKTCSCGATQGDALGHSFVEATCITAKTCSVCGVTEGNALGHEFTGTRTCNQNRSTDTVQCIRCDATENQTCEHKSVYTVTTITDAATVEGVYTNYKCNECGEKDHECEVVNITIDAPNAIITIVE